MYNPYMYENERITYPKVGEIILYSVNKGDNVYRLAKTFNSEVPWIPNNEQLNWRYVNISRTTIANSNCLSKSETNATTFSKTNLWFIFLTSLWGFFA